jgi:galactosyl transferase GMA12/MNN10 family
MSTTTTPQIAILTFIVGADYIKAMEPGMQTKREYAAHHGYTFVEGGGDVWDRKRPIAWSKLRFILKHLDQYDFIFWSDADVVIMNPAKRLEEVFGIQEFAASDKHMIWCRDACGNLNNGNVLFRGRSAWVRDFLERAYAQTDLMHHIWWDNAAFIRLYEAVASDRDRIETVEDPRRFNAYLFDRADSAFGEGLYVPGDFLIHFAGVYDINNIHRLMLYVKECGDQGLDKELLSRWRKNPPESLQRARDGRRV